MHEDGWLDKGVEEVGNEDGFSDDILEDISSTTGPQDGLCSTKER